jgi:hypothetical protein
VKTALMVFASDLVDEGFDAVVEAARERGGFDGIELAAVYHHARDVHPHNPRRKVRFLDGGAASFRPDPEAFAGQRIQPHLAGVLAEVDPLRRLLEVGQERSVAVRAWTINLHNFTLGERYPDVAAENAYGDRLLTDLCPANPDARAYARTVTAELARTGVDAIVAESPSAFAFASTAANERGAPAWPWIGCASWSRRNWIAPSPARRASSTTCRWSARRSLNWPAAS